MPDTPVRVAVVNDYEIVVAGIAAMLAPHRDRVAVVELDAGVGVVSDVDVVLYDTFGQVQGDGVDLEDLVRGSGARVVIYSWNTQAEVVRRAMERGAAGYLAKSLPAERVVRALEAVHAGRTAVLPGEAVDREAEVQPARWPGVDHRLTPRESEVLVLITQGLSNQEIADLTYLSINSVKTYIRTAYRKIGVSRRTQAVAWGMEHGMVPDRGRHLAAPPA
jgi:DNA-binding NarL/FixJ family response regulator